GPGAPNTAAEPFMAEQGDAPVGAPQREREKREPPGRAERVAHLPGEGLAPLGGADPAAAEKETHPSSLHRPPAPRGPPGLRAPPLRFTRTARGPARENRPGRTE